MAKSQISNFDKLAEELYGAGLVTEDVNPSITEQGLLLINSNLLQNFRVSVTTSSKADLVPDTLYQNQNPTLFVNELVNETTVCLAKNVPYTPLGVPFVISAALKAELISKNILKSTDITFDNATITKIDDNNSNVLITYPPKFPPREGANKSVIGVSIGRNKPLELSLIRMSARYIIDGQSVTKTLPVYSSNADGDYNVFVLIDTAELYDNLVDITISLSPEGKFLDGKHRINFTHDYTPAKLPSKAELIALDSNWLSAINAVTSDFYNQALDNTKSQLTATGENEYAQSGTTKYLYKMDGDLLKQSWYIKFESLLVDNVGANATITIGDKETHLNKADILNGSIKVGNYYLYEIVIDNTQIDSTTQVRVTADYDATGEDYLESNYNFSILVNETQAPEIPLFTFNFLRTRLVVTNENSILYDGYRYVQFKIPLKESSLVLLDYSDKVTQNTQIKIVSQSPNVVDNPTKQEVMNIANLTGTSLNFNGPMKSLYAITVTDGTDAEVVYQMRLPIGIQMEVGIGILPIDSKTGYLYQYRAAENDVAAESDPMPGLIREEDYYRLGTNYGILKHTKALMPGMGIAHMKLTDYTDRILLTDPGVKTPDLNTVLSYYYGTPIDSLVGIKKDEMHIFVDNTKYFIPGITKDEYNNPSAVSHSTLPGYVDTGLVPDAFVLYRSPDNKLYKLAYNVLEGVPVNLIYKVKLADLDTLGFTADKPMSVILMTKYEYGRVIEMTDPYTVTEADLNTSIPDYEVFMPTIIHVTDMFGFDN